MSRTDLELAEAHKYRGLDGEIGLGVTSIIGILDDDSKASKMAHAAAKITRDGGDHKAIWKAKAQRGTRVHGHCESWLRGEPAEVAPQDQGFMDALASFFKDRDPYPVEIERVVLSDLGYGGRFDFIAEFDDTLTLVDVKTGRPYFIPHLLQLSAYGFADGMAQYREDGSLSLALEPLPAIERYGCLYLTEDGEYDFREYPVTEDTFELFVHLLAVKHGTERLKASA